MISNIFLVILIQLNFESPWARETLRPLSTTSELDHCGYWPEFCGTIVLFSHIILYCCLHTSQDRGTCVFLSLNQIFVLNRLLVNICWVNKLFFFKTFYWSIIDLHSCVNFKCTTKWIIYIHSFSESLFIWFTTEYWVEFISLYSRSLLVIYFIYSSECMSIPISLFITSSHVAPLVTISLISRCVSLFCFLRSSFYHFY